MKRNLLLMSAMILLAMTFIVPKTTMGSSSQPMVPDYEVKVFLDPAEVLDSDKNLKTSVKSYFNAPSSVNKLAVQFMDTDNLDINDYGWIVRIRKTEEYTDSEFELVYKKRYPVSNGDIAGALATAANEGFTASETNYEAQVDWGYQKQTLSITRKKIVEKGGYEGMELPTRKDSRSWAIAEAPGKYVNWVYNDWGTDMLEDVHKPYGPVKAKRSIGTWDGSEIYLEVWQILNENGTSFDYIVEASFKEDMYSIAASKKADLEDEMNLLGWLLPIDQLKTQLILERY